MNHLFSTKRFLQLVLSHWTEYRKRYGLFLVAMFGIMLFGAICLLLVDAQNSGDEFVQYFTFLFCAIVGGCIFSGTFLSNLNDKSKGITYILLPASAFEKLLCTLLFTVPIFFLVFLICFYLIDIPFVAITNSIKYTAFLESQKMGLNNYDRIFYPNHVISLFKSVRQVDRYPRNNDDIFAFQQMFYALFTLQAFFLMGSAYFKKFAFVKSLLSGFVLCLFFSVFTFVIFKNQGNRNVFENYFAKKPVVDSYFYFSAFVIWFFKLGLGSLFYLATYFHIKEKEI